MMLVRENWGAEKLQRKVAILGIWSDTLLVERLESDWTGETYAL